MPDAPFNTLFYGDNLDILRDRDYFPNACVDLIYLDPPPWPPPAPEPVSHPFQTSPPPNAAVARRQISSYCQSLDNPRDERELWGL